MPGAWADGSEFQLLRTALEMAMQAGEIEEAPLDALTATLYGAARRGADFVARSSDPAATAAETRGVLAAMIAGLKT